MNIEIKLQDFIHIAFVFYLFMYLFIHLSGNRQNDAWNTDSYRKIKRNKPV